MKNVIILFFLLLPTSYILCQTTFNKTHDIDQGVEAAGGVIIINNGNYLIFAKGKYSFVNNRDAISIFECDQEGNVLWQKQYGKVTQSWYGDVGVLIKNIDKGYALCGTVYDSLTDQTNALLMKFNENGDTLFTKQYGGIRNDNFSSIRQMQDGSFYLLGTTFSYGQNNGSYYLVKTDSIGNELWYKTYGTNNGEDKGASIDITPDNNLVLSGGTDKFSPKPYAPWLIKTDTSGNIIWDKHVGTQSGEDCGNYTIALRDGGYVSIGCIDTLDLPLPNGYVDQIVKTNASGSIMWRRVLTNNPKSFLRRAKELHDGTLLFAGEIWNTQEGRYTGYLIKYDANGNLLWERKPSYIHPGRPNQPICVIYDFTETNDNYLVLVGSAFGEGNHSNSWLLKLDEYGCEITGCHVGINEQEVNNTSILAFPNPAQEHTTIAVKLHSINAHKTINITCYDTQGKTIYTTTATLNSSGYVEQHINTATWSSGIYYYTVNEGNEEVGSGKIIVQ